MRVHCGVSVVNSSEVIEIPVEFAVHLVDPPRLQIVVCCVGELKELISNVKGEVHVLLIIAFVIGGRETLVNDVGEETVRDPGSVMVRQCEERVVHGDQIFHWRSEISHVQETLKLWVHTCAAITE